MPVTIVVGGQYGSEGKGKVVSLLARRHPNPWVVRCGGPNSGHTTNVNGQELVLRQLPAAAGHENATLFLSAGCVVQEDVLINEIRTVGIPKQRVIIDPRAVLVTPEDVFSERSLSKSIGSTASGTGNAIIRRISRADDVTLVRDSNRIREHARVENVADMLHEHLDRTGHVIVEGTQGFALSLLHGRDYPFLTSRDTSASGFAMEAGLSPRQIDNIVMVIRTFPIRVAGNSGPLPYEISWEDIRQLSVAPHVIPELTSVTKQIRRVARFDLDSVRTAYRYNRPTSLALMGLDRLDYSNSCATKMSELSHGVRHFIDELEASLSSTVDWVGTGFGTFDAFDARSSSDDSYAQWALLNNVTVSCIEHVE